jgi:hypothetical protein
MILLMMAKVMRTANSRADWHAREHSHGDEIIRWYPTHAVLLFFFFALAARLASRLD